MSKHCGWWPECHCDECECQLDDDIVEPVRGWKLVAVWTAAVLIGWSIPIILALAFIGMLSIVEADAHDAIPTAAAPQGWSYPYACCSGYDCREVDDAKITEGPTGYTVPSGEVIAMTDKRIKESPDGLFHWCSVKGKDDSKTLCLFVPPRSY